MQITLKKLEPATFQMAARMMPISEQRCPRSGPFASKGLVAICGGVGVGIVLLESVGTILTMRYIFVNQSWRRCGVGTALMRASLAIAKKARQTLVTAFAATDCQDPLHSFFSSLSALSIRRQESFVAEITRAEVQRTIDEHNKLIQPELPGFLSQNVGVQLEFIQRMAPQWPDLARLWGYNKNEFDRDSSVCAMKNGKITAVSLITWENDIPQLRFLYADAGQGSSAMYTMMTSASRLMAREFSALSLTTATPQSENILKKLCRKYAITQWIYTAYSR